MLCREILFFYCVNYPDSKICGKIQTVVLNPALRKQHNNILAVVTNVFFPFYLIIRKPCQKRLFAKYVDVQDVRPLIVLYKYLLLNLPFCGTVINFIED